MVISSYFVYSVVELVLYCIKTVGGCECSNGYIGDDCSTDVSTPPVNISLPAEGLCTTTTRASMKTNIYGDFLSTEIWYKIRYFKVLTK